MRRWFDRCLDVLAPPRCAACGLAGAAWCDACGRPTPLGEAGELDGIPVLSGGAYSGSLVAAIRRYKYEPRPELSRELSKLLLDANRERPPPADASWVPVPLAFERLVERGFNQSALLARELSLATGRPVAWQALLRARDTKHQARLTRVERAENVCGAFEPGCAAQGPLVLVDDVVTTGSTVRACVAALERGGARVVAVWAVARAGK